MFFNEVNHLSMCHILSLNLSACLLYPAACRYAYRPPTCSPASPPATRPPVCPSLPVRPPARSPAHPTACLPTRLPTCACRQSGYFSVCLLANLPPYMQSSLSACQFIKLPASLPVCQSVCLQCVYIFLMNIIHSTAFNRQSNFS